MGVLSALKSFTTTAVKEGEGVATTGGAQKLFAGADDAAARAGRPAAAAVDGAPQIPAAASSGLLQRFKTWRAREVVGRGGQPVGGTQPRPAGEAAAGEKVAKDGKEVVAKDGKEVVAKDGEKVVAKDGEKVVAKDGEKVVAEDGKKVVAEDGKKVVAEDGKKVVAEDGKKPAADGEKVKKQGSPVGTTVLVGAAAATGGALGAGNRAPAGPGGYGPQGGEEQLHLRGSG